jgi:hypothetical protein
MRKRIALPVNAAVCAAKVRGEYGTRLRSTEKLEKAPSNLYQYLHALIMYVCVSVLYYIVLHVLYVCIVLYVLYVCVYCIVLYVLYVCVCVLYCIVLYVLYVCVYAYVHSV